MPVTIRRATVADAPDVFRLIRELAVYERLEQTLRATEADVARAMDSDAPRLHVLLAFRTADVGAPAGTAGATTRADVPTSADAAAGPDNERAAVGFALSFFTFSTFEGRPTLYLEDLFVEPEHRGAGIGGALLSRLAKYALEHDCRRMEWTALDWNTTARTFYENLGARPMSDWIIHRLEYEGIEAVAGRTAER